MIQNATQMKRVSTFGERLHSIMVEEGLSYEQLGRLVDEHPQTLNRYILGVREPRSEIAMSIAIHLGVNLYWLHGYDVPRNPEGLLGGTQEVLLPVLEVIRSGLSTFAEQDVIGYAPADRRANPETDFYLRTRDENMKDAFMLDGDLVLIHRQSTAENGQIIACIVNQENAMLRRFYRDDEHVILQSGDASYCPIKLSIEDFLRGKVEIIGVAVRLIRNL